MVYCKIVGVEMKRYWRLAIGCWLLAILQLLMVTNADAQLKKKFIALKKNAKFATVLNGTNQYWVKTSPSVALGTSNFTLIVKAKTSYTGGVQGVVSSGGNSAGTAGFTLQARGDLANKNVHCLIADGSKIIQAVSPDGFVDGKFHTVVVTVNRASGASAITYLDGVAGATASDATETGNVNSAQNLEVGRRSTASLYFNGMIGEVMLVKDWIPTAAEIMQMNISIKRPASGTVVFWYDWKDKGIDKSGNGNNLTNTNGAAVIGY